MTEPVAYQLLPFLADDEYEALKTDIAARGVQVPIEFDEHGNVLDGHHRLRVCDELGITEFPHVVRSGLSEQQKVEHVLALNLARRHLTREQRQELTIRLRQEGWSVRRIADTLKTSVGTVANDLASGEVFNSEHLPLVVTGTDGKVYPARRADPLVSPGITVFQDGIRFRWAPPVPAAPPLVREVKPHAQVWAERREAIASAVRSRPVGPDAAFYGRIVQSDALAFLAERETGKTDLCITSPPYWAKRTYGGGDQELGQEKGPAEYLVRLRRIIAEIGRVLAPTGWLFINVGDTFASQPGQYRGDPERAKGISDKAREAAMSAPERLWDVPDKSLCLIPWRLLTDLVLTDGWRCRNVVAWHKLGHQPENVGDRLTQAWEPVFALTRGEYPYYNRQAIEERSVDVWSLPVGRQGEGGEHPAVFPSKLVERAIQLACPPVGVVLDVFAGSGTTMRVAHETGRKFLGCDLIDWTVR